MAPGHFPAVVGTPLSGQDRKNPLAGPSRWRNSAILWVIQLPALTLESWRLFTTVDTLSCAAANRHPKDLRFRKRGEEQTRLKQSLVTSLTIIHPLQISDSISLKKPNFGVLTATGGFPAVVPTTHPSEGGAGERAERPWAERCRGSSWIHSPKTVFFSRMVRHSNLLISPWLLLLPEIVLGMFLLCSFI